MTQVYELENAKLRHYQGNYSQFVDKKAVELERQRKEFEKNVREQDRQARIADEQHRMLWFSSTHKTRLKMLERMEVKEARTGRRTSPSISARRRNLGRIWSLPDASRLPLAGR